jgi:hypothetical protein
MAPANTAGAVFMRAPDLFRLTRRFLNIAAVVQGWLTQFTLSRRKPGPPGKPFKNRQNRPSGTARRCW